MKTKKVKTKEKMKSLKKRIKERMRSKINIMKIRLISMKAL